MSAKGMAVHMREYLDYKSAHEEWATMNEIKTHLRLRLGIVADADEIRETLHEAINTKEWSVVWRHNPVLGCREYQVHRVRGNDGQEKIHTTGSGAAKAAR